MLDDILKLSHEIRNFEQEMLDLCRDGKLHGTIHASIGAEVVACAAASVAGKDDIVVSNHRNHAHYLAFTGDFDGLRDQICNGKGGSQHIYGPRFYSNGIQGGMVPVAAGLAYTLKGTENIVWCFIGDGTWGQGILYESLNIISLWQFPVLIICENNGIAQTTKTEMAMAGNIENRVGAFNINYDYADSNHIDELIGTMRYGHDVVSKYKLPLFIEVKTYRLCSHSKSDETRKTKELQCLKDPLRR